VRLVGDFPKPPGRLRELGESPFEEAPLVGILTYPRVSGTWLCFSR